MDDLISRKKVLKGLEGLCRMTCEYTEEKRKEKCDICHLNDAIEFVKLLPDEELWTSCWEGLPESYQSVIVTIHNEYGDKSFDYTSSGWLNMDKKHWIVGNDWVVNNERNNQVVAWMPLPKPYKEK